MQNDECIMTNDECIMMNAEKDECGIASLLRVFMNLERREI